MNIFYLIAIVIFFTSAYTAPAGNEAAIRHIIKQLREERKRTRKDKPWQDITSGQTLSEDIVKTSNRIVSEPAPGITREAIFQLLELPSDEPLTDPQIRLMRAYHACVCERLESFFLSLQECPDVPQVMLDDVYAELSFHGRLANEVRDVCPYRVHMEKVKIPPRDKTGGNNHQHGTDHVEPLEEFLKKITTCIENVQNGPDYENLRYHLLATNRLQLLERTDKWASMWTYETLNQLPLNSRWLPHRAAHERLIIERARRDVVHLCRLYFDDSIGQRLSELSGFIENHQRKLVEFETLLRGGSTLSTIIALSDIVHEPVQTFPNHLELLDLLGIDSSRGEDINIPSPEMVNFRGAAEERAAAALDSSIGRSERLEEQPTPARSSAVHDRSDTYNDRARGKRPMVAHESTNVATPGFDAWFAQSTSGSTHEGSSQGSRKLRNSGKGRGDHRDQL
ncbi:hypothetical protein SeMB42_g05568 [Synchytrium endobioticum]|uniref:Secreted protein n=1 Tax=Synchytrium endobioticum TaxID=286115 RepID=A0A507CQR0_9FUNG|nr:hypothetical protein SeLEV6574_g06341 [Synchytrium endobioticum]TPX41473.1 hypothetical protein SeMB42_g05568 [Synchytrium endobioticum]